jgi:hypothetical protein
LAPLGRMEEDLKDAEGKFDRETGLIKVMDED